MNRRLTRASAAGHRLEVAVKALIVRRGRVLLLERRADAHPAPGGWDTPGGRLEFGESLEEALRREVREELGESVSVRVRRVLNAWTFAKDPHTQLVGITFLCSLAGTPKLADAAEHVSIAWIDVTRATRDPALGDSLRRTLGDYLKLRDGRRAPRRLTTRDTASGTSRARRG